MQYEAKAGYMYDKVNRLIASYIIDYYRQYVILEVADLINMIDDQDIVKRILEISSLHFSLISL
jgi:DNA primase